MKRSGDGKDEARGFAGLADLLSDGADAAPGGEAGVRSQPTPDPVPERPRPVWDQPTEVTPEPPVVDVEEPAASSGLPWGWIAAGAVGLMIVLANIGGGPSSQETRSLPSASVAPADLAPAPAPSPSWVESPPPVGKGRVLSRDEIRYCRSENVRLQAMELEVAGTNSAHVDLFNRYVDDYNGRCGNFQYREGELESVQREVDGERARLSIEGAARIAEVPARTPAPLADEVETADPTAGPDSTGYVTEPDSEHTPARYPGHLFRPARNRWGDAADFGRARINGARVRSGPGQLRRYRV